VKRIGALAVIVAVAGAFVLWHAPLLGEPGRVRGFNSDAAILGLMGKKMFDGRGFDIFFWGQNYVGALTSMLTAGWGFILGSAGPLALRLAAFTEVLAGLLLVGWAVGRIDRRAGIATMIALALTPPVLLHMMITPLGAEMGYFMAAVLFAFVMQHLTAKEKRGWLSRVGGQLMFGGLSGLAWWMNQQVVFVLLAAGLVVAARSRVITAAIRMLLDRLRRRPMHVGVVTGSHGVSRRLFEAFVWVTTVSGVLLFTAFVVVDIAGFKRLPFVFGSGIDAILLIVVPQSLRLALPPWCPRALTIDEKCEVGAVLRFGAGFALGYLPVWLGAILGWYESSYVFGFPLKQPGQIVALRHEIADGVAHWIGVADGAIGIACAIAFFAFVAFGLLSSRSRARAFVALVPVANFIFYVLYGGVQPRYLIASVGMLFGLAALGAVALWDAHRTTVRALVVTGAIVTVLSVGFSAAVIHHAVLEEPDPLPLLRRVRAANCAIVYADFWIAYRFAFLDGEQRAWIPYLSQNRTRAASLAAQKLPGQRCLITKEGEVQRIDRDLPLTYAPPRRQRG
jgi:hypothetical protein